MSSQMEFDGIETLRWWQWHGRCLVSEFRGWPSRKSHLVVYHVSDSCKATSEAEAREKFRKSNPGVREVALFPISPGRGPGE